MEEVVEELVIVRCYQIPKIEMHVQRRFIINLDAE
jgi:hypothetical protein